MVGGIVIEASEIQNRPDVIFVDCHDKHTKKTTCAVLVEKNAQSLFIEIGDDIWWQGGWVMWTPANSKRKQQGVDFDIKIRKIGFSGLTHPDRRVADKE